MYQGYLYGALNKQTSLLRECVRVGRACLEGLLVFVKNKTIFTLRHLTFTLILFCFHASLVASNKWGDMQIFKVRVKRCRDSVEESSYYLCSVSESTLLEIEVGKQGHH